MLKKFGQVLKDWVTPSMDEDDRLDFEERDAEMREVQVRVFALRHQLVHAITTNTDSSDIIKDIMETEIDDFAKKYAILDVKLLLNLNNESVENLKQIITGLSTITKYGQHLLKLKDQYKSIPLSNPHVQSKILPLNGSRDILSQLGYSVQTDTSVSFPPDTQPDINVIANLLADMLLFKAEMKYFLTGSHGSPQQISALLPSGTIAQLNKGGEDCVQAALDMSMQSLALDNAKEQNSNSNDTSPYYSAVSGSSNKDSPPDNPPRVEALPEVEGEVNVPSQATLPMEERPNEIVTMQDFAVERTGGSETTSLRTPSSGFKISCSVCNEDAKLVCKACFIKVMCENCDRDWHSHPSRRNHVTERISDVDLSAMPDNIVKGPYGIIAQTENPAALISKRAPSDKSKKAPEEAHDGEPGWEDQAGNMPDFGSIMSGNMDTLLDNDRNSQQQQQQQLTQSPKLQARGGSEDRKVYSGDMDGLATRGLGPLPPAPALQPMSQHQPHHQQHHQQQQQQPRHMPRNQQELPQFLQDNGNAGFDNRPQPQPPHSFQQNPQHHLHHHHHQLPQHYPVSPSSHLQSPPHSMPRSVQGHFDDDSTQFQGPLTFQGHHHHGQSSPSQFGGQSLHAQIPPVSSAPQNFQQQYSSNPQASSPGQYNYSQQQQQLQRQVFPAPLPHPPPPVSSGQGYQTVHSTMLYGGGDNIIAHQQQQRPFLLQSPPSSHLYSQTGYYRGSGKDNNVPLPMSTYDPSPVHNTATNSWDMHSSPNQHQLQLQLLQQQQQQQQQQLHQQQQQRQQHMQRMPPNSLGNYPDKDETIVQRLAVYPGMSNPNVMQPQPSNLVTTSPTPLNPAPRQSQTYPQLSAKMAPISSIQEHRSPRPQEQLDKPNRALHSSYSTPGLAANKPMFKIIQRIKSQPAGSQQAVCSYKIDELHCDIDELRMEIDELLLEDDESNKPLVDQKMEERRDLLKMRKELEKLLKEIQQTSTDDNLEIYYPPSNSGSDQGHYTHHQPPPAQPVSSPSPGEKTTKPGIRRSPSKPVPVESIGPPMMEMEFDRTVSKGSGDVPPVQYHHPHHYHKQLQDPEPLPNNFSPNVVVSGRVESFTDNTSHKKSPTRPQTDPPQISLKADNLVPMTSNSSPAQNLKWQCAHCTFLNDASVKVCVICHKTTVRKQYRTDDGDADLFQADPDTQVLSAAENAQTGQQEDFVCEKTMRNRILYLQQEEEKMMAEKKKARKDFEAEKVSPPPIPPRKQQSPVESASNDGKPNTNTTATTAPSVAGQSTTVNSTKTKTEAAAVAGFSDLTDKRETGSPTGSTSSSSSGNQPLSAALALGRLKEAQACDSLKRDGQALIRIMKEVDLAGYPVDAVPIALSFNNSRTTSVMEWLAKHWEKNLLKIMKEVASIAASREQNNIGPLSMPEAQTACIECQGNLKHAVDVCIRKREELFQHLDGIDSHPREEILQIMFTQRGNREHAEQELVRHKLESFVERIWNKGELSIQSILYPVGSTVAKSANLPDKCDSRSSSALEQDDFQRLIADSTVSRERRIRMIMVESKLKSWGRGELVIDILDNENCNEHVSLEDVVDAVRNCLDRVNALAFLQQPCQICLENYPMSKIRNLNFCKCTLCKDCLKGNFTVVIKEKHVRHWTCPICVLPDMNLEEQSIDYLHMLQMLLHPIVTPELMTLFEEKVRDFSLQKDPSFRWCAHCGNGFLAENVGAGAMTCNACGKKTCFTCKRMWETQHENLTCEQFEQWKIDNDPNNQAIGLARHLEVNGIDCPKCNMRYSLAKGGCMHFKCPQCGHEFCSGCYEIFNHQGICKKYKACIPMGFHCHHPRDCFFFLRDRLVEDLQRLLETNRVPYNTQVPEDQEDKKHCPVMEQKEEGSLKKDEMCGKEVDFEMAGLCQSHYKEYLTGLINKHALDPVLLMSVQEMVRLLQRFDMDTPSRMPGDADQAYRDELVQIIQERLPLKRKKLDRR